MPLVPTERTSLLTASRLQKEQRSRNQRQLAILVAVGLFFLTILIYFVTRIPPNRVTFGALGASMVGTSHARSLQAIDDVLTDTVLPGEVAQARKVLLETRDLLDVFSPVFPAHKHVDLWVELRLQYKRGYELVGEFLDLNHAHIKYTQATCHARRNKVLEWVDDFRQFIDTHPELDSYLSQPLEHNTQRHEHESKFFWKDVKTPPYTDSSSTYALRKLGIHQVGIARTYLHDTLTRTSVLANQTLSETLLIHESFHNLRKTLRALCDEHVLFGSFRLLDHTRSSDNNAMDTFVQARQRLGDMNDNFVAYLFYVQHNAFPKKQRALAKLVDEQFADFYNWTQTVDMEGQMQTLIHEMKQAN